MGRATGAAPAPGAAPAANSPRPPTRAGAPATGTPFVGQPPAGRGRGEDEERERKYVVLDDEHLLPDKVGTKTVDPRTGLPVVPPVIG